MKLPYVLAASSLALAIPSAAHASQFVTFGSLTNGAAAFDSAVASAGTALTTVAVPTFGSLPSLTLAGGITVTRNNGAFLTGAGVYDGGGASTTAGTIDISPESNGSDQGRGSGLTFNFSTPINAFGFEVGDWGTCCQPSSLYVSFNGGSPINVGTSNFEGDVFLTNNSPVVFAGAFDDSSTFTSVQFWGDGFGEYLVVGGTLRTATLTAGSIGNGTSATSPLLPSSIDPNTGAMFFNGTVTPSRPTLWIDPLVTSGYDYQMISGPNIMSAIFPLLGDADGYQIYSLSGGILGALLGTVADGGTFSFGASGVTAFALRDIETALMLDPANTTAFVTGLTFAVAGPTTINVSQTPVTTFVPATGGAVPEPATWLTVIAGFGLMGASMRRRQKVSVRYAM